MQPQPRVGVCGGLASEDVMAVVNPSGQACEGVGDGTKSCVEQALSSTAMDTIVVDAAGYFETRVRITAHHWGWSEFRLCTEGEGRGSDGKGVTQECFNDHVLSFDAADAATRYPESEMSSNSRPGCFWPSSGTACKQLKNPSDYATMEPSTQCDGSGAPQPGSTPVELTSPQGSCCFNGGSCGNPGDPDQNQRWVFPKPSAAQSAGSGGGTNVAGATAMNGEYIIRLKLPSDAIQACRSKVCTLQWLFMTGNSPSAYPEAFRNCADFTIVGGAPSPPASTTPAPPTEEPATPTPAPALPTAAPTSGGDPKCEAHGCDACLATNNVCYAQPKSWCDMYVSIGYVWCGSALLQTDVPLAAKRKLRMKKLRGTRSLQPGGDSEESAMLQLPFDDDGEEYEDDEEDVQDEL